MAKAKQTEAPKLSNDARREALRATRHKDALDDLRREANHARRRADEAAEAVRNAEAVANRNPQASRDPGRAAREAERARDGLPSLRTRATKLRKEADAAQKQLTDFEAEILAEWGDGAGELANPHVERAVQEFEFTVENGVYADSNDCSGRRVFLEKGRRFTAVLRPQVFTPRPTRDNPDPKPIQSGRFEVESSDIDVHPGNLTSMIRTGWAMPTGPATKAPAGDSGK